MGIRPLRQPGKPPDRAPKKKIRPRIKGAGREHPYWQEHGWSKSGKGYSGYFATDYGRWIGTIKESYIGNNYFIIDPPDTLLNGSHSACFTHKGKGRYFIHFSRKPKDISSGIITIENLISESFRAEREAI